MSYRRHAFMLLAILLSAGCSWMGAGADEAPRADDRIRVEKGEPFWLELDQTAVLATDMLDENGMPLDASLTFNKVIEDSRCPAEVTCVWAGRARIEVAPTAPNARYTLVTLTLGDTTRAGAFRLLDLTPLPSASDAADPQAYRAQFVAE